MKSKFKEIFGEMLCYCGQAAFWTILAPFVLVGVGIFGFIVLVVPLRCVFWVWIYTGSSLIVFLSVTPAVLVGFGLACLAIYCYAIGPLLLLAFFDHRGYLDRIGLP